jgi:hypothetical protein
MTKEKMYGEMLGDWPNDMVGLFKPDHEWAYRWPDALTSSLVHSKLVVESTFIDRTKGNSGLTAENWGKPVVLRHTGIGLSVQVWLYRDIPREVFNPSPRERWSKWQITSSSKVTNGIARTAGVVGSSTIRLVGRRGDLLIRIEYENDTIERGQLLIDDLFAVSP